MYKKRRNEGGEGDKKKVSVEASLKTRRFHGGFEGETYPRTIGNAYTPQKRNIVVSITFRTKSYFKIHTFPMATPLCILLCEYREFGLLVSHIEGLRALSVQTKCGVSLQSMQIDGIPERVGKML